MRTLLLMASALITWLMEEAHYAGLHYSAPVRLDTGASTGITWAAQINTDVGYEMNMMPRHRNH